MGEKKTYFDESDFKSSWISRIVYDAETSVLTVELIAGRSYTFQDVPKKVFKAFMKAPSKGTYFNSRIRNYYKQ